MMATRVSNEIFDLQNIKLGKRIGLGGYADVHEETLYIVWTDRWEKVAVKRFLVLKDKEGKSQTFVSLSTKQM